jgi:AcrR family transcriptional regulator
MFKETSYQAVTIAEVAERAGLAKGTVYLYFKTKEELFLAIQRQQFEAWFSELDGRLRAARGGSVAQAAAAIRGSLEARAGLARLLAILHTILEQNIDFDAALDFKRMLLDRLTRTGALLEECLPFIAPGQGANVLLQVYALIIGVQHLADPAPVVRQVLQAPELSVFKVDFVQSFSEALNTLLRGLELRD